MWGVFPLWVGGSQGVAVEFRWDADRGWFVLGCAAWGVYGDESGRSFLRVVSEWQLFRVVVGGLTKVYVVGQFVEVVDPLSGFPVRNLVGGITLVPMLTGVLGEEGEEGAKRTACNGGVQETGWVSGQCFWLSGSVFGVIDMLRDRKAGGPAEWPALFPNLSLLVCTDMGTEPADFVAVQPGRVVFIHVKYSDRGGRSATSLHEVVVQALKNLMYLQPSFDGDMPGSWDGEWERRVQRVRYPAATVARNRSKGVLVGRV